MRVVLQIMIHLFPEYIQCDYGGSKWLISISSIYIYIYKYIYIYILIYLKVKNTMNVWRRFYKKSKEYKNQFKKGEAKDPNGYVAYGKEWLDIIM